MIMCRIIIIPLVGDLIIVQIKLSFTNANIKKITDEATQHFYFFAECTGTGLSRGSYGV